MATTTFLSKINNGKSTITDNPLSAGALTINVTTASEFPSSGQFLVTIWDDTTYPLNPTGDPGMELILCDSRSGAVITVNSSGRGYGGTSASSHASGSAIAVLITKEHFTEHETAINALETLWQTMVAQAGLVNGKLSVTVASNNLTVAFKTLAGSDPSTTDPIYVRIGSSIRSITAAISKTLNAGTNYFNSGASILATKEVDYFAYAIWNTTGTPAVSLGFARFPVVGKTYADFSSTATNEKHMSVSSAPNSTDDVEVVGRFNATLSATASFNWSIPATAVVVHRPVYETRILAWVPTLAFPSGTWSPTLARAHYQISLGSKIKCWLNSGAATTGSADGDTLTWTAPMTPAGSATDLYLGTGCAVVAAALNGGFCVWRTSTSTFNVYKYDRSNFGLGTNRQFILEISYDF